MWRIALLLVPFLGGCVIVPIPHPEYQHPISRAEIETEDAAFITPGSTTRADVLCALGEPDFWWSGERVMVYQWIMSNLYVIIATIGGSVMGDSPIQRYLVVRFDAAGRVERHEFREAPSFVPHDTFFEQLRSEYP